MSEEKPAFTDEEKREIEAQIRENHPEYNGVLDQMGEIREKLQVVDKRRFAENSHQYIEHEHAWDGTHPEFGWVICSICKGSPSAGKGADGDPEDYTACAVCGQHKSKHNQAIQAAPEAEGSWDMIARGDFSPSANPNKPIGMDFATALKQVREGKRVTRLEWGNPDTWLMMFVWSNINPKTPTGKYLTIHHADGAMHPLYINDGDLEGEDWVVVV